MTRLVMPHSMIIGARATKVPCQGLLSATNPGLGAVESRAKSVPNTHELRLQGTVLFRAAGSRLGGRPFRGCALDIAPRRMHLVRCMSTRQGLPCSGLTQRSEPWLAGGVSTASGNRQEALRLQRQSAATEKAAERQRRLRETEEGKASAQRLNEDLTGRVGRLESILRRGLDREAAIDLNTLVSRDEFPPLDLGAYGVAGQLSGVV